MTAAGCSHPTVLDGRAVSMRFDPYRVAGLPTSDGPSGPRTAAPSATTRVQNTDDGDIDRTALLAIEDIEDFWTQHYSDSFAGTFSPVSGLVSVDPNSSLSLCGEDASAFDFNALYCASQDVIAWDRVDLLPVAKEFFGDMTINGLLAHEYGHALQRRAGLVNGTSSTLVREQQADCLAGTYMRWVAEGHSPRFSLNTSRALDQVMAGAIAGRDPTRPTTACRSSHRRTAPLSTASAPSRRASTSERKVAPRSTRPKSSSAAATFPSHCSIRRAHRVTSRSTTRRCRP